MTPQRKSTFDAQSFLSSAGVQKQVVAYHPGDVIFSQGDPCEHVLYIQKGNVKLSVLSNTGREAVVAMLEPGEFFGEGCLAGQPVRMGSATAVSECLVLLVDQRLGFIDYTDGLKVNHSLLTVVLHD